MPRKTINYIYRFDPEDPTVKPLPSDADTARHQLEEGNRMFSDWMQSCRTHDFREGDSRYVVSCNSHEVGMIRTINELPKQTPFAVVVGCSDARVPTEMIFGQGFNDLFVIRVAGNVLGDECLGSIDFAINALSESVKVVVMLGHMGCGAVTMAVDAYLQPLKFWSKAVSHSLRSIVHRLFVPVQTAANGLNEVWGPRASQIPGYREALIEAAVCLNSAQSAYDLNLEVERAAKWEIEVLYGVYNLQTHRVSIPIDPTHTITPGEIHLAHAPTNPRVFSAMALQIAEILRDRNAVMTNARTTSESTLGSSNGSNSNSTEKA